MNLYSQRKERSDETEQLITGKSKWRLYIVIAVIMGIIFCLTYGHYILNPTYTDWLYNGTDLTQHYLGWMAYRASDWHFPIGNTDYLAYPSCTSVIFTDSIPCFAVLFKILSPVLPADFQYFGIWGIMCYMLQGILAARIVAHFTEDRRVLVLSSILLVFTPVMIFRMYTHTSLGGQWIILLALETLFAYKSYSGGRKIYWIWAATGVLAASVHIYFCMMCGMILVGYCVADMLAYKRVKRSLQVLAVYVLSVGITVGILGGFSSNVYSDGGGLGMYSMNINALFNPQLWGSRIFRALPLYRVEQYEGFAWLGAGCILLLFGAVLLLMGYRKKVWKNYAGGMSGLICAFLLAFLFALSPVISIGDKLICELKLPEVIVKYWSVFRSTGRFVWIPVYILAVSSCIIIGKTAHRRSALVFLAVCAALQIYDVAGLPVEKRALFAQKSEYEPTLQEEAFWKQLGDIERIEHVIFSKAAAIDSVYAITDWALRNDKTVSQFRLARPLKNEIVEANLHEALNVPGTSDIFIFFEDNELQCLKYDLHYYGADGYIIGYAGCLDGLDPVQIADLQCSLAFSDNKYLENGLDTEEGIREIYPGGRSFGPYWEIPAGSYRIDIRGENLSQADYTVCFQLGKRLFDYVIENRNEDHVTLNVDIAEDVEDLEIIVSNFSDENIKLYDISVSYRERSAASF